MLESVKRKDGDVSMMMEGEERVASERGEEEVSVTGVHVGRQQEGRQKSTNLVPRTDLSDRNNLHLGFSQRLTTLSTRKHDGSIWIA
jgi:hypothetical protein